MEISKTCLFFEDHDQGARYLVDTIHHDGRWWLVGTWLEGLTTGRRTPEWPVLLSTLRHQEIEGQDFRFLLNNSIPKAVLAGEARDGYVVVRYRTLDDSPAPKSDRLQ
jgi:hypothetical protein